MELLPISPEYVVYERRLLSIIHFFQDNEQNNL